MMGNHMAAYFYLKPGIDPKDYGFKQEKGYWTLQYNRQSSLVAIDMTTRKINCNGVSSKCLAVLFRIAENGGIEIEEESEEKPRKHRMSLTEAEARVIQAMRGHPPVEQGEKSDENVEPSCSE